MEMTTTDAGISTSRPEWRVSPVEWRVSPTFIDFITYRYRDSSGGSIFGTRHISNVAFSVVMSNPQIVRRSRTLPFQTSSQISTLPIADQIRHLQTALSVSKSELARILKVPHPTIYEWLDGRDPNDTNATRIRQLAGFLDRTGISAKHSLFPRLVRESDALGTPPILDLLSLEPFDETRVLEALKEAKAMGDLIDAERAEREAWLYDADFEEVSTEQRKKNLALNVALMSWPRE